MPTRTARTAWDGGLQDGSGQVELTSSGVGSYDVSFPKRAADEAGGTTSQPESAETFKTVAIVITKLMMCFIYKSQFEP